MGRATGGRPAPNIKNECHSSQRTGIGTVSYKRLVARMQSALRVNHLVCLVRGRCNFPHGTFFLMHGGWAIGASALASAVVLGAMGMLTSPLNGRNAGYSALRQLIFGRLAAAVIFGIGAVLGTTLS